MRKFLFLLAFIGATQKITGKPIDETGWDDLFVLFADEEWVKMFDELVEMF